MMVMSPKLSLLAFLIGFISSVSGGLFAKGIASTMLGTASSIYDAIELPGPAIAAVALVLGLPVLALLLRRFIRQTDLA